MNRETLIKFIGKKEMTLAEAMERIDANARGILFVTDNDEKLIGCISDGDIRRCLLHSGNLNSKISEAMNKSPLYLTKDADYEAQAIMKEKVIGAIPIIDDEGKLLDVILYRDIDDKKSKKANALTDVPVVIMAGGKGTRLYPYTKILPKPLIPIGDTPIVERIVDNFNSFGITDIYMTVNYRKEMIESYFNDLAKSYTVHFVEENKPLGTGGSIRLIEDRFDRPVFVANCDSLILADYDDIYQHHLTSENAITIVSSIKNLTIPYGVLHMGTNGKLDSIEEKPKLSYMINTGMYVINPETIDMIPKNEFFHMTQLVDKVIQCGGKVGMYPVSEDAFLDMGEFDEMKRMEEKLGV